MSTHAKLAPSAAKRWMNCPASVALIEKLPPRPSGYAAAEGTVAHDIHERYHEGKLEYIEMVALIGTTVMQEGHEVEITEEMIESAERYDEAIKADVAALQMVGKPAPIVSKTEARVAATSIDPECAGTADKLLYRKGDRLIVRDLKFGKGVVEVEDNEQMSVYAIGAMDSEAGWAFDSVELVIDQPRAAHEDGRERRWITTPAALKEFAARAKAAAAETRDPNAVVKAGSWCRSTYCPVMSKCPAAQSMAQEKAKAAFADMTPAILPEAQTSQEKRLAAYKELRLPEVKLLTDTQLVDAKRWKEAVIGFFDAVDEDLEARMMRGADIPGVKLVDGRVNRQWKDESAVEAKFGERAFERKLLSPAKLEKVVGKKAGVEELTFKPEPKKIVVLATDARPAAKAKAQDVFTALDVETPCVECEIVGGCQRHRAAGGGVKSPEPIWPQ